MIPQLLVITEYGTELCLPSLLTFVTKGLCLYPKAYLFGIKDLDDQLNH
jgi:hypothetical protein